jgi:predicted Zn-dependent protease
MANLPARFGLSRYEADEHYKIAISFYQKHNLEQALLHIGHALSLLPHNAEYLAAQGFFFLEDGVVDKAEEAFDMALRRNAYEMLANYGKGVLAYRHKDWQKALMYFLNAWAAVPERPETLYYLALASHHSGDNRKALDWMRQAAAAYATIEAPEAKKPARDATRWVTELERIVARS